MKRRGFLRSMLCTAAAVVAPVPAMKLAPEASEQWVVGIDPGMGDDCTVLTIAMVRQAVEIMRSEQVPAHDGRYHIFMHPNNLELDRVRWGLDIERLAMEAGEEQRCA